MMLAIATSADLGRALYLAHRSVTTEPERASNGGPALDQWEEAPPAVRFVWTQTARVLIDRHEF